MLLKELKELLIGNEIILSQKEDKDIILCYLSSDKESYDYKEVVSIEALNLHLYRIEVKD